MLRRDAAINEAGIENMPDGRGFSFFEQIDERGVDLRRHIVDDEHDETTQPMTWWLETGICPRTFST